MRLLITAGPTHEPIDAVRFLGNRSSGRLGAALAESAADLDWDVRTLIGPHADLPDTRDRSIDIRRFRSTADLEALLAEHLPWCDMLIMAAAVSDFTPVVPKNAKSTKWRRGSKALTLELTPTPDLLKGCSERARGDQILVGFALEPAETMLASARAKLERKGIDFIVANPLETMDARPDRGDRPPARGRDPRRDPGPRPQIRLRELAARPARRRRIHDRQERRPSHRT
jgi:phosphopantothenoylcysteine decarboxylase/phosphopantothenate--cysteine ligase